MYNIVTAAFFKSQTSLNFHSSTNNSTTVSGKTFKHPPAPGKSPETRVQGESFLQHVLSTVCALWDLRPASR